MKKKIFKHYAEEVAKLFGIQKGELFADIDSKDVCDARHFFCYLCIARSMPYVTIMKFFREENFEITRSSIRYSVKKIKTILMRDQDYVSAIRRIEKSI